MATAAGMVFEQEKPDWFSNAALFTDLDTTEFLPIHELEERVFAVSSHSLGDCVKPPGEAAFQRAHTAKEQGIDVPQHVLILCACYRKRSVFPWLAN